MSKQRCGEGRVHQRDRERDAINSGPTRYERQRDISDLAGAEQVPGKPRDVTASELDRDPEKWNGVESAAHRFLSRARIGLIASRLCDFGEQCGEEAVIETQNKGEQEQNAEGERRRQLTIQVHRIEDPI